LAGLIVPGGPPQPGLCQPGCKSDSDCAAQPGTVCDLTRTHTCILPGQVNPIIGRSCNYDEDCDAGCSTGGVSAPNTGWLGYGSDYACDSSPFSITASTYGTCQERCVSPFGFTVIGCTDPAKTCVSVTGVGDGTGYCGSANALTKGYSICR